MPHSHLLDDSDHWRKRAKEMRALAEIATKKDVKEALLRIASEYDGLANSGKDRSCTEASVSGLFYLGEGTIKDKKVRRGGTIG